MNRILIAASALLAVSGAALAQTPPLTGNYSQNVLEQHAPNADLRIDRSTTASIDSDRRATQVPQSNNVAPVKQQHFGR